ncbi:hypothetical protein KIPB_006781 [Kipferlia bialata]|uniref:Uncharacterized protein n=1 Tax=Kipferlia bialata TaxID=797122 RepID=A0A9K3GJD1_9EUKA|nr:hypothetical protein KIPB_006781 [Kipferlia bialata]|eukprot:g6781.t1
MPPSKITLLTTGACGSACAHATTAVSQFRAARTMAIGGVWAENDVVADPGVEKGFSHSSFPGGAVLTATYIQQAKDNYAPRDVFSLTPEEGVPEKLPLYAELTLPVMRTFAKDRESVLEFMHATADLYAPVYPRAEDTELSVLDAVFPHLASHADWETEPSAGCSVPYGVAGTLWNEASDDYSGACALSFCSAGYARDGDACVKQGQSQLDWFYIFNSVLPVVGLLGFLFGIVVLGCILCCCAMPGSRKRRISTPGQLSTSVSSAERASVGQQPLHYIGGDNRQRQAQREGPSLASRLGGRIEVFQLNRTGYAPLANPATATPPTASVVGPVPMKRPQSDRAGEAAYLTPLEPSAHLPQSTIQ